MTPDRASDLNRLLWDTYNQACPKWIDYFNRRDLVRVFNVIAKELYGISADCPVVEEFGSFVMDIFSAGSDLDLSINFSKDAVEIPRQQKIATLRKFAKKFYSLQRKGHVSNVQSIMTARVPIVKLTDLGTGIECDLSVGNWDGIAKSHVIRIISAIDERFQKLSFLVKSWAKSHKINNSKDGTLNSLSIISLVAFHLQTCNPPILPPFSALLKEGTDLATVTKVVSHYLNYGKQNKESLAELFINLFVKLASVENLWRKGLCVSLYEGSWIFKPWNFPICVEDFTDRSQNVARAVGTEEFKTIYVCIRASLHHLLAFLDGQVPGTKLMDLLFGLENVDTLRVRDSKDPYKINSMPLLLLVDYPPTKRMRLMEAREENQFRQACDGNFGKGWARIEPLKDCFGAWHRDVWCGRQHSFGETLNMTSRLPSMSSLQSSLVSTIEDDRMHYGYGPSKVPSVLASNPVGGEIYNSAHWIPFQSHGVFPETYNHGTCSS